MFKLMFTIFALILSSPLAQAAQFNLLCKEGRNPSNRSLTTLYEKIQLTTPTGPRNFYAASDVFYGRNFVPARVIAGDKGQNLAVGECGLAASILQGLSAPTITFREFQLYENQVVSVDNASGVTFTNLNASPVFPVCSTNIYQFIAQQAPNPDMFVVTGDAAVTCITP